MKRMILPALAIMVMASCGKTGNQETIQTPTEKTDIMQKEEKQKIEALLIQYKRALNTADATLSASLYTRDGVFMPTEAPSAIGSGNILKAYEFIFSQIQLSIEFYIDEIEIENDLAFATTSSKGTTLIHATGDTIPEANRELFVFEKANGEWKIARYMFNKTARMQ
ncbi:MAG: SgcJ/EcaC family oxidoreductase [Imperialibacter sp.]|uniref:YybH family protein n=1 Tax=Imperialibacter sp. TaxID=2038411 RepID=UPI0032EC623F